MSGEIVETVSRRDSRRTRRYDNSGASFHTQAGTLVDEISEKRPRAIGAAATRLAVPVLKQAHVLLGGLD